MNDFLPKRRTWRSVDSLRWEMIAHPVAKPAVARRKSLFPVMKPRLPSALSFRARLESIEHSGQYSNYGPQVTELQDKFAQRLNVKPSNVVLLANATLALSGLAQILSPTRWRVPSWTFVATPLSALQAGGSVVFTDVDQRTHRMDRGAESEPSIITLPFGVGLPPEWKDASDFPEIIDAAASLGSIEDLSGLPQGSNIVFSLHATKYLGVGEGGLVVTGNPELAKELQSWSNFGFRADRISHLMGTNAKMSEFQAAIAHAALDSEPEQAEDWRLLRKLSRKVDGMLDMGIEPMAKNSIAPYWITQFASEARRNAVEAHLKSHSVETRRWWSQGCHHMEALRVVPREGLMTNTDFLAATTLGLPYFRGMTHSDFDMIGSIISQVPE